VAGGWRGLHNGELNNFYTSPNVTKIMKASRMRRSQHATLMEEMRHIHKISSVSMKGITTRKTFA